MAGVDLLFGPMLIGVVLNMMLYGAIVTQMFTYFQRSTKDSVPWIRYLMLYLFLVETVNVVIQCGIIYDPLIIQNGTEAAITISPKLLPGDSILISIVSAPIQLFAAWRISVITGSLVLPGFIALLSLCSFSAGITVSTKVLLYPAFREFDLFTTEVIVWLVLSAVCDVVIAIGMTYALSTRKTGLTDIDTKINRIIRLTLETGVLTAMSALMDVILFLAFPRATINFIVDFPLSALYTCSILAMLNSGNQDKISDPEQGGKTLSAGPDHTHMHSHKPAMGPPPCSFHGSKMPQSQTTFGIHSSAETLVITADRADAEYSDRSDAASERTLTLHSHSDFYNDSDKGMVDVPISTSRVPQKF
ncbi:hypothetical protein B0H12DRAFT_1097661 [Mycena haematopus]|nr:hypothetical protein B0H12DRAFT_1097661 [Mycena haematopus]